MGQIKIVDPETRELICTWLCEYSILTMENETRLKATSTGRQLFVDSLQVVMTGDSRIIYKGYLMIEPNRHKYTTYRKVEVHIFI